MFRLEIHKELVKAKPSDPGGLWVEYRHLVREDGVRLAVIGSGRELQTFFRYTDRDISFELTAFRYDNDLKPTDSWEVYLGPALKQFSPAPGGKVSVDKAREIARNLQEALISWPPYGSEPPIRQVKILMRFWPLWDPAWGDTL